MQRKVTCGKIAQMRFGPVFFLTGIVCLTAFLFPGDTPFVSDESNVLKTADIENHQPMELLAIKLPFTPSPAGLHGTRGVNYGPLPVWLDQILLFFTRDPVKMVIVRALASAGVNAVALFWLTRTMRVSAWFAPLSMLTPWLWNWSRALGDNSLCVPLSAMAVAAYAGFLAHHRRRTLSLCMACLAASALCHLTAVALISGIGLHLFFFQRAWLKKFRWTIFWMSLFSFLVSLRYMIAIRDLYQPGLLSEPAAWAGWWFPLLGGHHLTAGLDWLYSTRPRLPLIFTVCELTTLLPHLAVWTGMALVLVRGRKWLSVGKMISAADHAALMSMCVAICQALLDGIERLPQFPHYLNATWAVYLVLAWYAIDALYQFGWKRSLLIGAAVYTASMIVVMGFSIVYLHRDGGTTGIEYGTAMQVQLNAARQIQRFSSDSPIEIRYSQWLLFPWSKDELLELVGPAPGIRPKRMLVVRSRHAYVGDARIVVEDFNPAK